MVLLMVFVLMLCVSVAFEMLLIVSSGDTNLRMLGRWVLCGC